MKRPVNQRRTTTVACLLLVVGGGFFLVRKLWSPAERISPRLGGAVSSPTTSPVVRSERTYVLGMTSDVEGIHPARETTMMYRITNDRGETVKDFSIAHEKLMHFIVVRKDLQHFQHVHPSFDAATGTFTVAVAFPTDGPYRLFADFTPAEDNPQRLPVTVSTDLDVGETQRYSPRALVSDARSTTTFSAYTVTLDAPQSLQAEVPVTYRLRIDRDGRPVTDLEPYLGALGHSVILKAETLDFIHTHVEETRARGPDLPFTTSFPAPGLYKLFTQFQHEGRVLTAEHVVSVERGSGETRAPEHGGEHPMQ